MEKIIKVHLRNGTIFVSNKGSLDIVVWGVNGIGHWENIPGENQTMDVQIPWSSIDYIQRVIS